MKTIRSSRQLLLMMAKCLQLSADMVNSKMVGNFREERLILAKHQRKHLSEK